MVMNHKWTKADDECLTILCKEGIVRDWKYIGEKMELPPSACLARWDRLVREKKKKSQILELKKREAKGDYA